MSTPEGFFKDIDAAIRQTHDARSFDEQYALATYAAKHADLSMLQRFFDWSDLKPRISDILSYKDFKIFDVALSDTDEFSLLLSRLTPQQLEQLVLGNQLHLVRLVLQSAGSEAQRSESLRILARILSSASDELKCKLLSAHEYLFARALLQDYGLKITLEQYERIIGLRTSQAERRRIWQGLLSANDWLILRVYARESTSLELAKALNAFIKEGIFNPENIRHIAGGLFLSEQAGLFFLVYRMGLSPRFLDACLIHFSISLADKLGILTLIDQSHLSSPSSLSVDEDSILDGVVTRVYQGLGLSGAFLAQFIAHLQARSLYDPPPTITEHNVIDRLREDAHALRLATVLGVLGRAGLLTGADAQARFEGVLAFDSSSIDELADLLSALEYANLSSLLTGAHAEANFAAVMALAAPPHKTAMPLAYALYYLRDTPALVPGTRQACFDRLLEAARAGRLGVVDPEPTGILRVLRALHNKGRAGECDPAAFARIVELEARAAGAFAETVERRSDRPAARRFVLDRGAADRRRGQGSIVHYGLVHVTMERSVSVGRHGHFHGSRDEWIVRWGASGHSAGKAGAYPLVARPHAHGLGLGLTFSPAELSVLQGQLAAWMMGDGCLHPVEPLYRAPGSGARLLAPLMAAHQSDYRSGAVVKVTVETEEAKPVHRGLPGTALR
jgi:hypothetical protein